MTTLPSVDLLYLTGTGHVLATFTRAAEPAQIETDLSGFLGDDGFYLSGFGTTAGTLAAFGNQEFIIPANQFSLARMDWDPVAVMSPRQRAVTLPISGPVTTGTLGTAAAIAAPLPLTVTGVATGTPYLLLVYGPVPTPTSPGTPVQVVSNTLTAASTIPLTGLTSGQKYFAAAFFAGQQLIVAQFTA
jgi:hypothetical protein